MKHIYYSNEQIDRLSKDERIKHIDQYSIRFTIDYRLSIYERVKDNICDTSVKNILLDDGFDLKDLMLNKCLIHNLANVMKKRKPCGARNKVIYEHELSRNADKSYDQFLLNSSKFVKNHAGISFSEDYKSIIYHFYPQISIEEYLINDGLDVKRIGYQRIYNLKKEFDGETSSNTWYDDSTVNKLKSNIYIKTITNKQIRFHSQFYRDAHHLSSLHIDDLLDIFEINYCVIPISTKKRLEQRLKKYKIELSVDMEINEQYVRIQRKINQALTMIVENNFDTIKANIKSFNYSQRKDTVYMINEIYQLKNNDISVTQLCHKCGISRSNFYSILNNDHYGEHQLLKEEQDNAYIDKIKEIIEYRGYPKGSRMIYMMQNKFDMHISRNKIIRLCRKANLRSEVRKGNNNRKTANELIKRNVKANLVKRQFKMNKPLKLLLTDVTYIKYNGRSKTAYLSDVKDAVSGKSICHVISENNDLNLALDTLKLIPKATKGAIFHSDQGSLYLSDQFQLTVKELGYQQSMSKRGNCWDNSPKESQFGHMKDENKFSNIKTFEELVKQIDDYYDYYNNERPQWNRNKMTPVEYEKYLNTLSIVEYQNYIDIETKKYDNMMVKSIEKAIKRANDLKAL